MSDELRHIGRGGTAVNLAGRGHLFGLFTTGRRPELKALSGQEKLPVLQLPDGTTVNGSANIIAWAHEHAPAQGQAGQS